MSNSFLQCVASICGLEMATLISDYKVSFFGGKTAVIEGHRGIVEYSAERVSFALKKGVLRICGDNLCIKGLEKNFAVLAGKVSKIEVENEK